MRANDIFNRLMARIKNLFSVGDVTGVDDGLILQIKTSTGRTNDRIKRIQNYGFISRPLPQSKAYLLFAGGVMSRGIAVCVEDTRHEIALKPGEVAVLDDKGNVIHLSESGIKITSPMEVIVEAPKTTINSETAINGNLKVNGEIADSVRSMSADRGIFNGHNHPIPNGNTSKPNQSQ